MQLPYITYPGAICGLVALLSFMPQITLGLVTPEAPNTAGSEPSRVNMTTPDRGNLTIPMRGNLTIPMRGNLTAPNRGNRTIGGDIPPGANPPIPVDGLMDGNATKKVSAFLRGKFAPGGNVTRGSVAQDCGAVPTGSSIHPGGKNHTGGMFPIVNNNTLSGLLPMKHCNHTMTESAERHHQTQSDKAY